MMSDQLGLFDPAGARAARDEAIATVASHSPHWRSIANQALQTVAYRQRMVTSDDVWLELDRLSIPRPPEGRAMGPVMQWGVREGYIAPSGFTQGTQKAHHADVMRVYASLVAR